MWPVCPPLELRGDLLHGRGEVGGYGHRDPYAGTWAPEQHQGSQAQGGQRAVQEGGSWIGLAIANVNNPDEYRRAPGGRA